MKQGTISSGTHDTEEADDIVEEASSSEQQSSIEAVELNDQQED